jgi:heme exporter protein B
MIRDAWILARKDLLVEARGRRVTGTLVPFVLTLLLVFGFAFGPGTAELRASGAAILWLATAFAGVLALRASFEAEQEDAAWDELVLAPVEPAAIYLGKVVGLVVELALLQILALGAAAVLFDLEVGRDVVALATVSIAGIVGIAAMGATLAALAARARAREAMLPLLVLPLLTPVLIGGTGGTAAVLGGETSVAWTWVSLLVPFAAMAIAAGVLVAPTTIEGA